MSNDRNLPETHVSHGKTCRALCRKYFREWLRIRCRQRRGVVKPVANPVVEKVHRARPSNTNPTTSRFHGVHFDRGSEKWIGSIYVRGRKKIVGAFDTELQAAESREPVAISVNSKWLNFALDRKEKAGAPC